MQRNIGPKTGPGHKIEKDFEYQPYLDKRGETMNHAIFSDRIRYCIQVEAAAKGKSNVCCPAAQLQILNGSGLWIFPAFLVKRTNGA
jgi:hypothetical protein